MIVVAKKVLIVGVGSIGSRHLRCFLKTNRVRLAICDSDASLAESVAKRYGIDELHTSLEGALANPPDIAVICTPAHLHIPMGLQLAESGVDLLIEKPLSTSSDRVGRLTRTVSENHLTCGVAYVMRHHPCLRDVHKIVASGRFGAPLQLTLTSGQHFPYYRPAYRETYYANHNTGGGAIQDALTHMMNVSQWLLGPTTSLVCDADHLSLNGVTVEDTVHVLSRHNTTMASLTLNQFQSPNESTLLINFECGTIRIEFHRNHWHFHDTPEGGWELGASYKMERDDLFIRQANIFLDNCLNQTGPTCSLAEATHTLNTNLAMLQSTMSRQWIDLS